MNRPWFQEDNRVDFEAEGFRCAMRRGPLGAWCGYVGVPSTHPWFGKTTSALIKPTPDMLGPRDPNDHNALDVLCMALSGVHPSEALAISLAVRVHGGLTYSADHEPCGKPDGLWWFDFDCAHLGDLVPAMESYHRRDDSKALYRNQSYVVSEVQSLAAQLAKVQP